MSFIARFASHPENRRRGPPRRRDRAGIAGSRRRRANIVAACWLIAALFPAQSWATEVTPPNSPANALLGRWLGVSGTLVFTDGTTQKNPAQCVSEISAQRVTSDCRVGGGRSRVVSSYQLVAPDELSLTVLENPGSPANVGASTRLKFRLEGNRLLTTVHPAPVPGAAKALQRFESVLVRLAEEQSSDFSGIYAQDLGKINGVIQAAAHVRDNCAEMYPQVRQANAAAHSAWSARYAPFLLEMEAELDRLALGEARGDAARQAVLKQDLTQRVAKQVRDTLAAMDREARLRSCVSYPVYLDSTRMNLEFFYPGEVATIRRGGP